MSPSTAFMATSGAVNLGSALFSSGGSASSTFHANDASFNIGQMLQRQALATDAAAQEQQALIAQSEAHRAAVAKAREGHQHRESQALAYDGSGIMLDGSPMEVLNETVKLSQEEVDALEEQGKAQANLIRSRSAITQNQGLASLLGQTSDYNAAAAKASISDSQTRATGITSAIGSLTNLFGNAGSGSIGGGTFKPINQSGTLRYPTYNGYSTGGF